MIRLHMNENPLGMSPRAMEHIKESIPLLHQYPSSEDETNLRSEIASLYSVDTNQIVLGNGSSEILDLIARSYLNAATSSVYARYSFELIDLLVKRSGAKPLIVPTKAYQCDIPKMIAAVRADTSVLWLINPNNPTGSLLSAHDIQQLLDTVPTTTLVVLDEAYSEYVSEAVRFDSIQALARHQNLIICRTFSKIYGLGGIRIGYALTHPTIAAQLTKLRLPMSSSKVALRAAYAALKDQEFLEQSFMHVATEREYLTKACSQMGIKVLPSHANFITLERPDAQKLATYLAHNNILVRWLGDYGLPDCIRISIGMRSDHVQLLDCLSTYITHKDH